MHAPSRWRQSMRALGGRMGDQWERERRDTLFLMAGTLVAAIPAAIGLPPWVGATFALLWAWRLGLVLTGRPLPSGIVRIGAAIACSAAVYAQHETLIGREAGVSLLVLFVGLKLMEMRARRDLFVVLFMCLFMLLTGFLHSQTMTIAAIALVAVVLLVTAMVTMQFGLREAPIARRFRTAGVLLLQALPLATVMFVLFPRLQAPLWGAPEDTGGASTGLSDSMSPGNISKLSNSEEVAFRVQFEGAAPDPSEMYWRGPVLGHFDGRTWRAPTYAFEPPAPQITHAASAPVTRYSLTLEPTHRRWLFALDAPVQFREVPGGQIQVTPELQLLSRDTLHARVRYEVDSLLQYQLGLNETAESLRNWTELPPGFNRRTLALAAQWREAEHDPATLVNRALRMFREEPFRYTMTPPILTGDTVDAFLFGTRSGFCEHYASAFVVLMRALDIPARVVTGYQGAERSPVDDYWIVSQADAHAWAEVWLPGRGWTRVDPVNAVAPHRIDRGSRALRTASMDSPFAAMSSLGRGVWLNLDAITHAWNQWVLSYDGDRQHWVVSLLGLSFDDWRQMAGLLAGALALLLGAAALLTLRPRLPRDPVERAYREYCERLAVVGLERAPHETAMRHLERIGRGLDPAQLQQALAIVSDYNRLRYGADAPEGAMVRTFRQRVRSFRP